jgi:hypothetical protein
VDVRRSSSRRCRVGTRGQTNFPSVKSIFEARLKIRPCTHIDGLLLGVDQVSRCGITVELFDEFLLGEGSELLDSDDSNVGEFSFLDLLDDVVVELARNEDDLLDGRISLGGGGVGDDGLELALSEVGDCTSRLLEAALGDEDEGGTTEVAQREAAEHVEVGLSG